MSNAITPLSLASFAVAVAAVLGNLVIVATRYSSLPAQVPAHYGFSGRPDAWGNKSVMWIIALLPLLTLLLMLGLGVGMVTTAEKSEINEVRTGVRLLAAITAYLSVGAFVLTLRMLAVAEKHADGLGRMSVPLYLAGLVLVIFLFR